MIVMKFGGSSVANAENIIRVVNIIKESNDQKVVVFSAISGITNSLEEIWNDYQKHRVIDPQCYLIKQVFMHLIDKLITDNSSALISKTLVDCTIANIIKTERQKCLNHHTLLSVGEKLTSFIIQQYCQQIGLDTELIDAEKLIRINSNGGIDTTFTTDNCRQLLTSTSTAKIYLTQGFICSDANGRTSVLGRGGSDYSATLIGSALMADAVEIWSDTNGVLNNDPRRIKDTYTLDCISYDEAIEMAYYGAKILHPKCLIPVKEKMIKVLVKNTFNTTSKGTVISSETNNRTSVKAVALKDGITVLTIKSLRNLSPSEFITKTFEIINQHQQQTDLMSITDATITIAIEANANLENYISELSVFSTVSVLAQQSIITFVGNLQRDESIHSTQIFKSFKTIPIKMISYSSSNTSISIVIDKIHQEAALQNINEQLFNLKINTNV